MPNRQKDLSRRQKPEQSVEDVDERHFFRITSALLKMKSATFLRGKEIHTTPECEELKTRSCAIRRDPPSNFKRISTMLVKKKNLVSPSDETM